MPPLPPFGRIVADGAAGRAVLRDAGFLEQDRFRLLAGGLAGLRQSLFNASITAGRGSGSRRLCRPGFPVNAPKHFAYREMILAARACMVDKKY